MRLALTILFTATAAAAPALAQTVTGVISGSVVDPTGAAAAGSAATLTSETTGDRRAAHADSAGAFLFSAVLPDRYTLAIEAAGFKRVERTHINLTANERLSLGRIVLEVGAVTDSVTVTAEGEAVQIESNERSAILTNKEMDFLMSRGRNFTQLLTLLPGGVADDRWFEIDSFGSSPMPAFGGLSASFNSITVDGMTGHDVSNPSWQGAVFNMDAISEVKVLLGNYKAEYGRNGGAVVTAVSRTGGRHFRGTAYHYQRNEALNANSYFNNRNGLKRAVYRYATSGFTLGGPVTLPGKANRNRDKLFFFFSEEFGQAKLPGTLSQLTVPTAPERAGDYSATTDLNGRMPTITDPLTRAAFPGNIIPASRINATGRKLLELFPQPNFFDVAISRRTYNYNFQESVENPSRQEVVRIDYNASSKLRMFFRGATYQKHVTAYSRSEEGAQPWPMVRGDFRESNPSIMANVSYIITPTLVYEGAVGMHYRKEVVSAADGDNFAAISRDRIGLALQQLYPANNPLRIIPSATFGGVTNAAALGVKTTFPNRLYQPLGTSTHSLAWVAGPHTFKGGLYVETARSYRRGGADFAGAFSFSRDTNNPYDTNWAYSNALTGAFYSYTESDTRPNYDLRGPTFEWYLQDTWKASRRLTIDYGVRFTWFSPYSQANNLAANFVPALYNSSHAVSLYRPALNAQRVRVAQNPLTGELASPSLIGALAPGSGDVRNGLLSATDPSAPKGFVKNRGIHYGPRFGFAYDLFGDGRMAVRGGFGVMYQTHLAVSNFQVENTQTRPNIFHSTFDLLPTSQGVLFPRTMSMLNQEIKTPTVYSYSFGVQRDIGWRTVLDVAYVGNQARHLAQSQALNAIPYGARFLDANRDSTTGRALSDDYLRPYIGYSSLTMPRTSTSNYNSLQVQANRRFARGAQFGVSWTWGKSMGFTGAYPTYVSNRLNYGKTSLDRTHGVNLSAVLDVPDASRFWSNRATRGVLGGWQTSLTAGFQSGRPWAITYSYTTGLDVTGGGDFARPNLVRTATLPHSERSFSRFFDAGAVSAPLRGDMGNAPLDAVRGPGRNNWNTSIFKHFRLTEGRTLQFRMEMYNTFNHPSFNAMDTAARFDATGTQVNSGLGQLTGALTPRVIQMSLRVYF